MVVSDDNGKLQVHDKQEQEQEHVVIPTSDENASEPEQEAIPSSGDSADAEKREVEDRFQLVEKLYAAVAQSNDVTVEALLLQGAALDIENQHGKFPIHVAAHRRDHHLVELLKKHGASIDDRDTSGKTQLFCEAESGNPEVVMFLLEHGAVVGARDLEAKTALFAAAGNGHLDVVRMLVENGADVSETDQHLRTPLLIAAKQGHLEVVQYLADDRKAVVDATQKLGRTPLMFAASNGHLDVATFLLHRSPASISTEDQNKWMPLHVAAGNGRSEIVELLIAKDATVNEKGPDGATPLYLAAQRGNVDIVTMLLEKDADVNLKQKQGKTPLLAAAENGFADVVKLLINAGASVHEKDESKNSPLLVAASKGNIEIVKMLVTREASVNEKDADGRTPLMAAARHGHLEIARLLIENGANIEDKQRFGRTPLMLVISNRHREVVRLLLNRSASVESKDDKGWSPLHTAAGSNQPYVLSMLIDKKAKIDDCTRDGATPLDLAIQKGFGDVINLLLQRGQNTVYKNPDYDTLLISAARSGHITVLKFLRERGASLHARASDGETVLLSTARWGFRGYFKLLVKFSTLETSKLPDDKVSLLLGTLKTMHDLCNGVKESQPMYDRVVARLTDACLVLQDTNALEGDDKKLATFANILYRFCRQLLRCRSRSTISRFIASSADNSNLRDLHEEIDNFMKNAGTDNLADVHKTWQGTWVSDQMAQRVSFHDALSDDEMLKAEISSEEAKIDAVTHLKFMLANPGRQYANEVATTETVIRRLVSGGGSTCEVPEWFVSRYNVELEDWNTVGVGRFVRGKWLKSSVMVSKCDLELAQFEEIATTWKKLGHPNVLDLFGACRVGSPRFFVCGASTNGSLLAYLLSHKDRVTRLTKLHEAAQGMLFLREWKIVHGNLTTDKILVGEDGKAKIGGFELAIVGENDPRKAIKSPQRDFINWKAPEIQRGERPTFASDTYALGVCILDILTMEDAWRVRFGSSLRHYLLRGSSTPPPGIVNPQYWSLVTEMCTPNPKLRPEMEYVVSHFESFIETAKIDRDCENSSGGLEPRSLPSASAEDPDKATQQDLKLWKIPEFDKTIEEQLTELKTRCCNFPDSRLMAEHVLSRLKEVYGRIVRDKKVPGDKEVVEFVKVVTGFAKHLKTTVTQVSFSQRVKSQRIVFAHHTYHSKIDRLLGVLKISLTDPLREWKTLYDAHVMKLRISGLERGSNKQSGSKALVSQNTLKSIKYQSPSSLSAVTVRQTDTESESTDWFIKLNQIEYDADAPIAEGGFGTIYRGVWLWGTQVVVKFIHNDKEVSDSLFLHEVNIWHRLQHPHVVRLWGACNVGKRYFVCEYASNGTLNEYLRRQLENLGPEKLFRLKWKLLHDVALGLQYVHGRSVIHNDLKCDNILVGDDKKAKLTDFGLSSIPNRLDLTFDPKQIGAIPWKAPEYLESGVPSFESDIYSFAMCIVEVFTETIPYGGQIASAVKRHIKNGVIPLKPDVLDDNEWNLIELMTRKEPAQRVGISFVVDRLQELAVVDSSATTEL